MPKYKKFDYTLEIIAELSSVVSRYIIESISPIINVHFTSSYNNIQRERDRFIQKIFKYSQDRKTSCNDKHYRKPLHLKHFSYESTPTVEIENSYNFLLGII